MKPRHRRLRLIFYILLLVIVGIQLIPVDRTVPQYDASQDFIAVVQPPAEFAQMIQASCYDCHSYQSEYPWYAYVQPVSGWIQGHIDHGREHFNLSTWGAYSAEKADHKLEEAAEEVGEGHMPLSSFLWIHSEARLTDAQRTALAGYFDGLRE